tara:strand:- start:9594 stop:9947 length:354 start_codon:yes stop_codon:yes gene_type:complete
MPMDSKTKAEAYTICNAGLSAYLAKEHKDYRLKKFSNGALIGIVSSVPAYMITNYYQLPMFFAGLPLAGGILGGLYEGLTNAESEDALHISDFDTVCESLDEEESPEDEDEDEQSSD